MHYLLSYEAERQLRGAAQAVSAPRTSRMPRAAVARGESRARRSLWRIPIDGAALLFRGDSPAAAEQFAKSRPLRRQWCREALARPEWTTVVGEGAETKI